MQVWKAVCDETSTGGVPSYLVAVKTSKVTVGAGAAELLQEATIMAIVPTHPNLVSIVGVVTRGAPLLLVVSFCENGSLLAHVKTTTVALADKLRMASEIARGMVRAILTTPMVGVQWGMFDDCVCLVAAVSVRLSSDQAHRVKKK